MLAELYLSAGKDAKATELYSSLVARAPDQASFHNNLAWVLARQDQLGRALNHATTAAELAPDNPGVLDTLGVVHLKRGENAAAVEHLAQAAEAAPGWPDIQANYAEALIAAGDRAKATAVLDRLADRSLSSDQSQRVERLRAKVQ